MVELNDVVLMSLRWIHFLAGIVWIGHLYFFNLVNGPFAKTLDGDTKKKVVPQLMPRALWWFRWGAMITLLSGLLYITWRYFVATDYGFKGTIQQGNDLVGAGLMNTVPGQWISLGGTLGLIMWFNVWFIIWPAQKRIIGWVRDGQNPPEMAALTKRAFMTSRLNTYLSVPMLFCMGGGSHFTVMSLPVVLVVFAIGFALAYIFIKVSAKAGASI